MKKTLLVLSLAILPTAAFAKAEAFKIDTSASKATWEGSKLVGSHNGEMKIKGGELTVEKGALTGGQVEVDMMSLNNKDISDAKSNADLVGHLKSDDFFSAEKHPVSTFKITKVEKKDGKTLLTGDLTIKGVSNPVTFPVDIKSDKKSLTAKGEMTVNRTLYGIKFRALKYFPDIGDKVIKDNFKVGFDVSASK